MYSFDPTLGTCLSTFGRQSVADVPNKRLAKIKEKIMSWKFNMIYNPGKMQNAADAISRSWRLT